MQPEYFRSLLQVAGLASRGGMCTSWLALISFYAVGMNLGEGSLESTTCGGGSRPTRATDISDRPIGVNCNMREGEEDITLFIVRLRSSMHSS